MHRFLVPRAPTYEYAPLKTGPREFRLVRLLPAASFLFGRTPQIEIITVDLDAACSYDTLSYAWSIEGAGPPNRKIVIKDGNGERELRVYKSLEVALLSIKTDRPLFVDQLCINQSDEDEKANQVKLMRDIYSNCNRVLIWLGPGTKQSNAFFDFTQTVCAEGTLSRSMGPHKSHFKQAYDAVMDSTIPVSGVVEEDRDAYLALITEYGEKFPLDGYLDVQKRGWFNRLWTIQEIALAPQVTFICGSKTLCYDCFRGGALFFTIYNTHWIGHTRFCYRSELKKRNEILERSSPFLRMISERRSIHEHAQRSTLYELVLKYSVNDRAPKTGATKEDDRLFAVMGLADIQSMSGIKVIYGQTAKVYTEFAAMLAVENLDILLYSQFPKRLDLPSWVPDWSMNLSTPHSYLSLWEPVYSAGGDMREVPQINVEEGYLSARGAIVDEVVRTGEHYIVRSVGTLGVDEANLLSVKQAFDDLANFIPQAHRVAGDPDVTIARVLDYGLTYKRWLSEDPETVDLRTKNTINHALKLAQLFIDTEVSSTSYRFFHSAETVLKTMKTLPWYWEPVSEVDELHSWAKDPLRGAGKVIEAALLFSVDLACISVASGWLSLYQTYIKLRQRFCKIDMDDQKGKDLVRARGIDMDLHIPDMTSYSNNLDKNKEQRAYVTKTGYVGAGPLHMQEGDVVAILFGSTAPHLLRRNEVTNDWSYIGETYCDGVMHGEIIGEEQLFIIS